MSEEPDADRMGDWRLFCVCECCGRYVGVHGAMGDWIRTCVVCVGSAVLVPRESLAATLRRIYAQQACPHILHGDLL